MGAASGQAVDHKNGNKLDNRRANLRFATQRQNTWNRAPKRHTRTGLKGVKVKRDRFEAVIQKTYIGTFATAHDAARAYDAAALQRYGEFARTNFPT